ncbi:MAG: amidase [Mycobacterium sp.]
MTPEPTRRQFLVAAAGAAAVLSGCGGSKPAATGPADDELVWTPATELARLIRDKTLSPVELTRAVLDRAERLNADLHAFLHLDRDGAMAAAKAAEDAVMKGGSLGLLHGLPVSIKDGANVKGMPTTNGSRITPTAAAAQDGSLAASTRAAGAVIFGKTNLPAFAHKDVTDNLLAPPCPTPWKAGYNSGGSSGGAGAAAAAGLGPLHHGSDGGGSIRIPADRCGVFGFKPSIGRIGHPGSMTAAAVGHDGPLTRTVADAALLMDVWSGPERLDYLSIDGPKPDFAGAVRAWEKSLRGRKVALTFDYGWIPAVDPEVRRLVSAAAARFSDLGCAVEEVNLKWPNPIRAWEALWYTTAAASRSKFAGHQDWIDPTLLAQMDVGATISGVEVAEALQTKDVVFQAVENFFAGHDLLLSPVCAVPAFPFDAPPTAAGGVPFVTGDVRRMIWNARIPFTPTFNMTGHPAASVPCGFTDAGLPVGLHVIAARHQDALVLQAAAGFEAAQPWAAKRPPAP